MDLNLDSRMSNRMTDDLDINNWSDLCETSPSMSVSLSLTPDVVTDRPVTPNDFLMSFACRGSASQVMPSVVHSTILPSTRMFLRVIVVFGWSKDSSIRNNPEVFLFQEEPSGIDDVTERKSSSCTHTRSCVSR